VCCQQADPGDGAHETGRRNRFSVRRVVIHPVGGPCSRMPGYVPLVVPQPGIQPLKPPISSPLSATLMSWGAEHAAALQDRARPPSGTASDSTHGPGGLSADAVEHRRGGVHREPAAGWTRPSSRSFRRGCARLLRGVLRPRLARDCINGGLARRRSGGPCVLPVQRTVARRSSGRLACRVTWTDGGSLRREPSRNGESRATTRLRDPAGPSTPNQHCCVQAPSQPRRHKIHTKPPTPNQRCCVRAPSRPRRHKIQLRARVGLWARSPDRGMAIG
jgi:hypothetical protein